jgi:hypothetical protein
MNTEVVLDNIINLGTETEEKIHEKFRDNKDRCIFFENRDYVEECYDRFNHLCERKGVNSGIIVKSLPEFRKKGYFIDVENHLMHENDEMRTQERIFSELKRVKDVQKKAVLDWMELKISECNQKRVTVPRIGLRHHRMVDKGLKNV